MWRRCGQLLFLPILMGLLACDSPEKRARQEPLLAAEVFHWCLQPLRFQPPPARWARQKHNSGGLRGIWFTHTNSVGERIYVSEYYKVGERALRSTNESYSLDEVVEEIRFSTEGWPVPADSFTVAAMQPDSVAGMPAYRLDFTLSVPERRLVGREYYVLKNNYLFEAAYLGLAENLPLFERVVETITFPPMEDP